MITHMDRMIRTAKFCNTLANAIYRNEDDDYPVGTISENLAIMDDLDSVMFLGDEKNEIKDINKRCRNKRDKDNTV